MKVVFLSISATGIETCDIQTIEAMHMTNFTIMTDTYFFLQTYGGPGGVLDISLGGEVRLGPSYPDPV